MKRRLSRFVDRGKAALERLKRRSWQTWAVVLLVLYAVLEVVRGLLGEATTLILVWLFDGLVWVLGQPMGLGGLALLMLVALLAVLSWWETRPVRKEPAPPQKNLSEHERRLVQDHRTIWNRQGQVAVSQMHDLLREAVHELRLKRYWAVLLDPVVRSLRNKIDEMTRAVAFESNSSIEDVRARFNEMYSAYLDAIMWLARLKDREGIDLEGRFDERLEWWRDNHYEFRERLLDLHESPEHHQTMKMFPRFIDDESYARLLRAAETRDGVRLLESGASPEELDGQTVGGEHSA